MRVGILTFHGADNYGAVLQAFALQEYIRSLGNDVDMVNYSPKAVLKDYKIFSFAFSHTFTGIKKYLLHPLILLRRFIRIIPFARRVERFNKFRQRFFNLYESSFTDIAKIPEDYDAYIIGSDQVWNIKISQDGVPVYFGKFKKNSNSLCLSYAASAGDGEELLVNAEYFTSFDAIAVREISLKQHLQRKFNVASEIVVDPTLLVEPEVWNKVAATSSYNTKEKYVLVYMVYYTEKALRIARKIAGDLKMKLIIIDFSRITKNHFVSPIGPEDFVNLFKNASYVVTTSFHGTVFSVIFNRDFYFISTSRKGENRIKLLLEDLKLDHRIVDDMPEPEPVDYEFAGKILPELRASSEAFLKRALEKK